ncbi:thioredoxin domain-containing protein [Achromobacter sp. GG226]|uniref:DsbA family protein n=1 Tax=Verticiella alkaliphila TaxID=2779529 RepID=UPI001C0C82C2|nr:thioredoxin domain-containing protein [Verticiella sp. GG226]MBU4610339.1 thioredoxin domain-containing protein [Verticiella sp. GG226]
MNRRSLVLVVGAVAVAALAVAAVLSSRNASLTSPVAPAAADARGAAQALVRFHSPVLGRMDAPVTIVEFFDPSCEGCRAFHPHVKALLERYPQDVRVVMRYVLFHKGSEETVRLLEAARRQNLFAPVLDAILAAQPDWHDDPAVAAAWAAAARAGLNEGQARAILQDEGISRVIQADAADVEQFGIRGTPTFYIDGQRLDRLSPEALQSAVESAIRQVSR